MQNDVIRMLSMLKVFLLSVCLILLWGMNHRFSMRQTGNVRNGHSPHLSPGCAFVCLREDVSTVG